MTNSQQDALSLVNTDRLVLSRADDDYQHSAQEDGRKEGRKEKKKERNDDQGPAYAGASCRFIIPQKKETSCL